jgi:hypothetical protein
MANEPILSAGISVAFTGDDSGSLTAQLLDITKDAEKTDELEITHQGISALTKLFMPGFTDLQSISLLLHFHSDNTRPANGESGTFVLTLTNAGITLNTLTLTGFFSELNDMDAKLGQKVSENAKFKINTAAWSTVV